MGIVKIRHRGPGNVVAQRSSGTPLHDVLGQQKRLHREKDPGIDSDDDEFMDVGCELIKVGGQICDVPYELYDLPDLNEILSLDSWNSCLTEEEKFSLTAYLPDMDQDTFWLTMKELLTGDNLFFGSPLKKLLQRLKGGYYSPEVSHLRECLQLLQRRKYYHSLKSYHESMSQKFVDMKKAWSDCEPSTSVEERVRIWNKIKVGKPVFLVDLNAFPAEEEIKADKMAATFPVLNKTRYADSEGIASHTSANIVNELAIDLKRRAKGVLKIKPVEMNSQQNHLLQTLPSEPWGSSRRLPKGVLKIKPRNNPPGQQDTLTAVPLLPTLSSVDQSSLSVSRLPPQQFATSWKRENFHTELPLLHQTVRDVNMYRSVESHDLVDSQQRENFSNIDTRIYKRKTKVQNDLRLQNASEGRDILPLKISHNLGAYSDDGGRMGGCGNGENLWPNPSQLSRVSCASSGELCPYPLARQGRRQVRPVLQTVSEAFAKISSVSSEKHNIFPMALDQSEHHHNDESIEYEKQSFRQTVYGVQREGHMPPITYKRKKPYTKQNAMDSLKQTFPTVDSESTLPSGSDYHPVEKTKPIKIKVKGFSGYTGQFKGGLLNGLQPGSSSTYKNV